MALAMAIHELAGNAAKYGALSIISGKLTVAWKIRGASGDRALSFTWTETRGPVVQSPSRRGFGTMLIERTLTHERDAEVRREFLAAGVRCAITISLTDEIGHPLAAGDIQQDLQ